MNCLLTMTSSTFDQLKELQTLQPLSLAIQPEKPVNKLEPYGAQLSLSQLAKHHHIYLVLHEPSEHTILSVLSPYAKIGVSGVIPTFIKSRADIERLHAILSVSEAEHALQDGSMKIIPELGRYPSAFHKLVNLSGVSTRLTALTWNEEALTLALGAKRSRDDKGALLPPFQHAQTQILFIAKSAHLFAMDAAPVTPAGPGKSAGFGFNGMAANTLEEARQIQQVFPA
ncbi:hypothetical protein GCM10007094_22700 [Pseudovibrio japonicus]|uniref:HpcH/HpaI aldolase/citrate lyase domain-containing protein n=1 Tax=Pseudovibrio japonicus TaxID=366534 RepID=A0ABQ3EDV3_9HYPH|nr:citrate lyase subunit beta [Pseudovibrio japonicus]GHB33150.1 hypothetical protein GCM10007094_22700 [Pseudovibrio japonicus]